MFQKRLYDQNFNSLSMSPRVFCLMSHQREDPRRIVSKLMMENLFVAGQRFRAFDPRGMCIVQGEHSLYLWVGAELPPENK